MTEYLEATVDKFIFKVAADRRYSPAGVWALEEGGRVRLGLTDYQQQRNGDVAFVHLKPVASELAAGEELAEIETIKANLSLPCPFAATVIETNGRLERSPELVNEDPYGAGWLAVVEPADGPAACASLLDAAAYLAVMKAQAEEELA